MKPKPFNSYRLFCIAIVIAFVACTYAVRHFAAIDGQLFRVIRSWKCSLLDSFCSFVIEPKYWIPYYNIVLIILYLHFGLKFTKVIFGIVLMLFAAWLLSEWSMYLGFGDAVFLTPGSLPAADLAQLRNAGHFSYHHVALVSALVTYLCIVLYRTHKWFKALFIVAALTVPFSCIYMGTLLPFSALAAILIGMFTTAVVSPIYVQQILLTKPTV